MTLADDRDKWNRRYAERAAESPAPQPNPLLLRFLNHVDGGWMLDAACGLGTGIAAAIDRVQRAIGVDLSEAALAAARSYWGRHPRIDWIQADVARLAWPPGTFALVCAFGFTDWDFLRQVPRLVRPGGLFCFQGFSRRELELKPGLDPAWTSTPVEVAALFPAWRVLAAEESEEPPFRVSFAGLRPADEPQERR
jgi:SAM-dependent methyltransferase